MIEWSYFFCCYWWKVACRKKLWVLNISARLFVAYNILVPKKKNPVPITKRTRMPMTTFLRKTKHFLDGYKSNSRENFVLADAWIRSGEGKKRNICADREKDNPSWDLNPLPSAIQAYFLLRLHWRDTLISVCTLNIISGKG